MIRGVGVDLVSIPRVADLIDRFGGRAARRLFTADELAECEARARPADCLAGRFATKEAFVKALGTGLASGLRWHDVAVRADARGCPQLVLSRRARDLLRERGADRAHVSLSHDADMAIAIVVIEGDRDQV